MTSEWRTRTMRREGKVVWVIYQLNDEAAADVAGNRQYWPRNDCPAWAEREESARHMAGVLNELAALYAQK